MARMYITLSVPMCLPVAPGLGPRAFPKLRHETALAARCLMGARTHRATRRAGTAPSRSGELRMPGSGDFGLNGRGDPLTPVQLESVHDHPSAQAPALAGARTQRPEG